MKIPEVIKQRRLILGITQQDLADFSGVGLRTIRQIEAGKGNPSVDTLNKILSILGLEMDFKIKDAPNINDV
ncbi:MAG: helix-turn-helix domain-containing protein [Tannerellaceae bacterium]|jgi:y4mF family transcriptional regulator|nr:helix-turn-helix domain-containing protein [Tannerellaceae bacterium]